jgi:outer membrane putative beta-barrel porin/alpha-amylase
MRRRIIIGLALSAYCLALIGKTEAGPPFVTDDPEVPPIGGWEINIPFTLTRTPGLTQMNAPLLDMNYGLPQLQIEFDIPIAVSSDDANGTNAGLGDLLYGIKWRFFEDEKTKTQIAIYPQMFAPTGNYREGLGDGRPNYILPLLAEKSWDKWTLYGDIGYRLQIGIGERSYWYAGAVLQREINDRLSFGVELFGNTPAESNDRPDIAFNVGGSLKLNDHLNFIFTGGRDLVGDTHAMVYLGLQILTKVEK